MCDRQSDVLYYLQRKRCNPQATLQRGQDVFKVRPIAVELVDKGDRRDAVLLCRAPHRF